MINWTQVIIKIYNDQQLEISFTLIGTYRTKYSPKYFYKLKLNLTVWLLFVCCLSFLGWTAEYKILLESFSLANRTLISNLKQQINVRSVLLKKYIPSLSHLKQSFHFEKRILNWKSREMLRLTFLILKFENYDKF